MAESGPRGVNCVSVKLETWVLGAGVWRLTCSVSGAAPCGGGVHWVAGVHVTEG